MPVKKSELYSTLWEACNKLRGGVEPAQYKDYVLILLFLKYVSDRFKGDRFGEYEVNERTSFDALVKLKGRPNVAEETDKIIEQFLADNHLTGEISVHFNSPEKLGSGKELVDKVSGLIGVFENPALDFRNNRSGGDDIIGDAYEYFMMKFAQESGRSKGQFYTPGEVSRIIARLIGIDSIKPDINHAWTLYDPACGSGSLLIRADDEAPKRPDGKSIVSIYGQEKDNSTAGLAKMNLVLHGRPTAEIKRGSTLSSPLFIDNGQMRQFDFAVMNPPFSDKSWSDGVNTDSDEYHRFDGFGVPPEKNGDYAWFLHVIKSLNPTGKAGIVMPHGVLFRGSAEEEIRRKLIETHYIKGIISLPANLFYGTGIPACIILIDKENARGRTGIFFIDASGGFKKDGSKNRLREQDIERIVRVFKSGTEIEGYSRFVSYAEILGENGGNLNVPRYIQKPDDELPHNIAAHITGGIPKRDIDSLGKLWGVSPGLKGQIFARTDSKEEMYALAERLGAVALAILIDSSIVDQRRKERVELFNAWCEEARSLLMDITEAAEPKELIRVLGDKLLESYADSIFVDKYNIFDCLMNYWNDKMQDDVHMIRSEGWKAGRMIEEETVKGKVKSWEGVLIPREIMEWEFFGSMRIKLQVLSEETAEFEAGIMNIRDEYQGREADMPQEEAEQLGRLIYGRRKSERELRGLRSELDKLVMRKYAELTEEEIRHLVFDVKWMKYLAFCVEKEADRVFGWYVSRVEMIARRYERSLAEILKDVEESRHEVEGALGRMGYKW